MAAEHPRDAPCIACHAVRMPVNPVSVLFHEATKWIYWAGSEAKIMRLINELSDEYETLRKATPALEDGRPLPPWGHEMALAHFEHHVLNSPLDAHRRHLARESRSRRRIHF